MARQYDSDTSGACIKQITPIGAVKTLYWQPYISKYP